MTPARHRNIVSPNVVGLPVTQCASLLLEHGVIAVRAAIGEQRGKS